MPHMNPSTIKPYYRGSKVGPDGNWFAFADRPSGSVLKIETLMIHNPLTYDELIIQLATGNVNNIWMKSKIPPNTTLCAVMAEAPYYVTVADDLYIKVEMSDGGSTNTEIVGVHCAGLEVIS